MFFLEPPFTDKLGNIRIADQEPNSEIDQVSGHGREISVGNEAAEPEEKTSDDIGEKKRDEHSGHPFPPI